MAIPICCSFGSDLERVGWIFWGVGSLERGLIDGDVAFGFVVWYATARFSARGLMMVGLEMG